MNYGEKIKALQPLINKMVIPREVVYIQNQLKKLNDSKIIKSSVNHLEELCDLIKAFEKKI